MLILFFLFVEWGIKIVIWVIGFLFDYSWFDLLVFDCKGYLKYIGGVVDVLGVYVMGLFFMRKWKFGFIDGVVDDVKVVVCYLKSYFDGCVLMVV